MSQQHERLQLIDTLKAPIIDAGRNFGYEVVENYDLGAGPIHVVWVFKPGCLDSLPDMRLGFICLTEFSQYLINESIIKAMLNLIDKLVFVVPSQTLVKNVRDSIESTSEKASILQLRKYVTVATPTTLVSKVGVQGAGRRRTE